MKKTLAMLLALVMIAALLPLTGVMAEEEASFTVLAKTWSPYNPGTSWLPVPAFG